MKQHLRLSHASDYQQFFAPASRLCSKFNTPGSPCEHCGAITKAPRQHPAKRTVLWHSAPGNKQGGNVGEKARNTDNGGNEHSRLPGQGASAPCALQQETAIKILRQDYSWVLFVQPGNQGPLPLLFAAAQKSEMEEGARRGSHHNRPSDARAPPPSRPRRRR